MTTAFQFNVNGIDVTPPGADVDDAAEWDVSWEERVDGVGTATATIQDRTGSKHYGRARDEVEMLVNGTRVFHGEITRSTIELPPGRRFPRWKITMSDFNTVPDLRLVGVPDGRHFISGDGGTEGPPPTGTWDPIDLDAHCEATDQATVQALFDAYARLPDTTAFDTATFVKRYINANVLQDKHEKPILTWTHTTLRGALDELAAMAGFPIFWWIDPDDAVHWINFRDFTLGATRPSLGPRHDPANNASAFVTNSNPNGSTSVGGRGLSVEFDATNMPEQCYVVGVTDYVFNGPHDVTLQGTGFEQHDIRDTSKRQILVDGQALTQAQKNSIAKAYLQFGARSRVKGRVTVGSSTEAVDGWRCGQSLKVIDARLPSGVNGKTFPIQRVAGSLSAGNDFRVYTLEFGDAPIGRFGQKYKSAPQRIATARLPGREHKIYFPTHHLRPSSSYVLTAQMVDRSAKPVRQSGVPVKWSLRVLDAAGTLTDTGSITPIDSVTGDTTTNVTDRHGRTSATLTTGGTTRLHYHVKAVTEAQT